MQTRTASLLAEARMSVASPRGWPRTGLGPVRSGVSASRRTASVAASTHAAPAELAHTSATGWSTLRPVLTLSARGVCRQPQGPCRPPPPAALGCTRRIAPPPGRPRSPARSAARDPAGRDDLGDRRSRIGGPADGLTVPLPDALFEPLGQAHEKPRSVVTRSPLRSKRRQPPMLISVGVATRRRRTAATAPANTAQPLAKRVAGASRQLPGSAVCSVRCCMSTLPM